MEYLSGFDLTTTVPFMLMKLPIAESEFAKIMQWSLQTLGRSSTQLVLAIAGKQMILSGPPPEDTLSFSISPLRLWLSSRASKQISAPINVSL